MAAKKTRPNSSYPARMREQERKEFMTHNKVITLSTLEKKYLGKRVLVYPNVSTEIGINEEFSGKRIDSILELNGDGEPTIYPYDGRKPITLESGMFVDLPTKDPLKDYVSVIEGYWIVED